MPQADFAYGSANDRSPLTLAVSIFADRARVRGEMRDDAEAAGMQVRACGDVAGFLNSGAQSLGEVILIDSPAAGAESLAALARLDVQAAGSGAQLVVSTTLDSLDAVFACLDQSNPEILVDPSRAERVLALGRVLARFPNLRLRELGEEDRLMLLRLTEQVGRIAERIERIEGPGRGGIRGEGSAFRFESPASGYSGPEGGESGERLVRAVRPPLPDPRLVRRIIRQRQARARFFDGDLFADPAWDILLDLTAARAEHIRVSVTSLCIASGVPPTTALRWISQMTEAELLQRVEDETDGRRAFIALTDKTADTMARYFAEMGKMAAQLV